MDPLSVCASVWAILTAAQSGLRTLRKVRQCWKAPQEIDDLIREIESLQSSLRDVASFAEANKSTLFSESLSRPIARASSIIDSINTLISSSPLISEHLSDANRMRILWLHQKKDIKTLLEDLKAVRIDLSLQLGLIVASSVARIEETLGVSIGVQNRLSQQLSIVIDQGADKDGSSQQAILRKRKLVNDSSSGGIIIEPSTDDRADPSDSNIPQSETSQKLCGQDIQRSLRFSGQRPYCNEKGCQRPLPKPFTLTYLLPKYLLRRYINLTMHYAPLDGPTFSLRAPRVTAWSHLFWRYANKADLPAIQKMFAQHKASPFDTNLRGANGLMYAANNSNYRLSQFLIEQGADPDLPSGSGQSGSELLFDHAFSGWYGDEGISIVGSLLKDSDYVETRGLSILHKIVLGIVSKNLEAELKISTACIDVGDARKRTSLAWAVIRDDLEAVQTLLAFGADPKLVDDFGVAPLSFSKSVEVSRALLKAGANVKSRSTFYQRTALHQLCRGHGTVEVVDLLVQAGVEVDVRDIDHETPLMIAVFWHKTATAERLIEHGADVNVANLSSQANTIHLAVSFSHYQIIPLLLAHDVAYTATNVHGRNIAHMAARSADTQTTITLAKSKLSGLDFSLKDIDGKTPADYLAEREIYGESEIGVHDAFETFARSVSL
ncbi:MAG: hypothetical protein Q9167_006063 [Letrouitia subvulpina]